MSFVENPYARITVRSFAHSYILSYKAPLCLKKIFHSLKYRKKQKHGCSRFGCNRVFLCQIPSAATHEVIAIGVSPISKRRPSLTSAPFAEGRRCVTVCPRELPPEVANGTIVFPVRS